MTDASSVPTKHWHTAGCNLACRFCQNWDISKSKDIDTLADSASPEAIAEAARGLGCRSVAFTYNDPTIFLEYLRHETDGWFEITTLLIPGLNDGDEELDAMTSWVVDRLGLDVPMHFTAFHPDYKLLDRPPTPAATLTRARAIARANGVRHAYTGNVHDADGQSTYCTGCGDRVVRRDWYQLGEYRLDDDGRCLRCGTRLPGVFHGPAEAWGPRRQPVVLRRR